MRTLAAFLLTAILACTTVSAETFPDSSAADRRTVAVTVYNVNLALVRETRVLELERSGVGTMRFMDVPSAINPRTVHLKGINGPDVAVLEQNYEYDLISPEKLMEKYVGKEVEIVEQADDLTSRVVRATLLSTTNGPVYQVDDKIVLGQTGRIVLPELPGDLVARPTLVWTLKAQKPGKREVEASYLTDGMNWSADYVAVISPDETRADLTGWVTVENRSGATFENAALKLVAGDVRRITPPQYDRSKMMRAEIALAAPEADQFREESFFEYHLYSLERPTTLKHNQTKQITLLQGSGIPVEKKLILAGSPWYYRNKGGTLSRDEKFRVFLEFNNDGPSGLGIPLPKGTVRVYKKDASGAEQFAGEDAMDHTPRDERVSLFVGEAFDVVADRVQTEWRTLSPRESESSYRIGVRNRKDEAVTVLVREPVGGEWQVVSSSHPARRLDAGTLEFEIAVPAGGEIDLTYRVHVRW